MILFFDTETTGFPNFNARARDPKQPHIVQLAAILTQDDGTELDSYNTLIKPEGWNIPDEVSKIHGITNEIALERGIPERESASKLLAMIRAASLVVAHNITLDKFLARIAMRRFNLITDADDLWWKQIPTFCTMRAMTPVCQLPGKYLDYKWPKLQEAYKHAFGNEFDGAHDALADVRACRDVYFWLKKRPAEVVV